MNDKTGGNRGPRRAGILAMAAAVAVLATGCGFVHVHFGGPGSAQPPTYQEALAYARCMRAHGLPGFPLPNPSGRSSTSVNPNGNPHSPAARANDACKQLLTTGTEPGSATAPATPSPPG
jgi:hypothetical protein